MRHRLSACLVLTGAIAIAAMSQTAGAAAAGGAGPTIVKLKPLALTAATRIAIPVDRAFIDEANIAFDVFEKATVKHGRTRTYPTGRALRHDLLRLLKRQKPTIVVGPVPSVAHGKPHRLYVGNSTRRRLVVTSFVHADGHAFTITTSVGQNLRSLSYNFGAAGPIFFEAVAELGENVVAQKVQEEARKQTVPAYLTGRKLVVFVRSTYLLAGIGASASKPPSPTRAKLGELYLGATTPTRFSATRYVRYATGHDLEVTEVRGLSGPGRFTVEAIKVN